MNNHIVDEWVEACESGGRYDFFQKYPLDDRVMRLFAVSCCREIWGQMTDARSRNAVEVAEIYADGLVGEEELKKACDDARDAYNNRAAFAPVFVFIAAYYTASVCSVSVVAYYSTTKDYKRQGLILAQMYPTAFNEQWITSTTTSLAQQIYDKKDFSLMPILADALQDVDCDEEILNHLRGTGPFYKGHYIIDRLIGKRLKIER